MNRGVAFAVYQSQIVVIFLWMSVPSRQEQVELQLACSETSSYAIATVDNMIVLISIFLTIVPLVAGIGINSLTVTMIGSGGDSHGAPQPLILLLHHVDTINRLII